jgi:hypothetical protein
MGSKRFIHCLALFSVCCTSANAIESIEDDRYSTFGGINYKQSLIRPTNQWDQLFVKTQPGFDVYLGWRFHPNFSAEVGYDWSENKPLATGVAPGSSLLGVTNGSIFPVELTGKVRFKTSHVDLNTFIPFAFQHWAPEWIVSLGVGTMKPNMKIAGAVIVNRGVPNRGVPNNAAKIPIGSGDAAAQSFESQFSEIEGKSMAVFRGGFGLQASLIKNVGIRALVRYERTAVLRGQGSPVVLNPATAKIFQNGFSLSLGLYLKF